MKLRRAVLVLIMSVAFVGACGGGGDDDDSAGSSGTSDSNSAAVGAFSASRCADEARRISEAQAAAAQAATGGGASFEDSADALQAAADASPSEIRADFKIVAEGYAEFARIMGEANFNPSSGQVPSAEAMEKLQAAGEKINTDEFKAAAERVTTWFAEKCGK
jgi:hypothetical protein